MESIYERFSKLGTFGKGILPVYDTRHAVEEFERWFPNLTIEEYKKIIAKGVKSILRTYGLKEDNFMIIDKKSGMRIPIEVRNDRSNPGFLIGVIATTLNPTEVKNLRNEVEVFVENNPWTYSKFKLAEGYNFSFNYLSDKNKVDMNFEEIYV